jgi:hypothetical protein
MPDKNNKQFELKGKDAEAAGMPTDEGFLVREGGMARKDLVPSATDSLKSIDSLSGNRPQCEGSQNRRDRSHPRKTHRALMPSTGVLGTNGFTSQRHDN